MRIIIDFVPIDTNILKILILFIAATIGNSASARACNYTVDLVRTVCLKEINENLKEAFFIEFFI